MPFRGAYNVSTAITLKDEEGNVVDKYKPSTLYKLSFSFTTISGSNPKGYGFQLVSIVDGANTNAGTMANPTTDAQVTSKNGRSYFEHKNHLSTLPLPSIGHLPLVEVVMSLFMVSGMPIIQIPALPVM
ncbi:hypothetical protein [Candidatus Brachybacter algidus]|uniref:hypothetical protein n=1 Tax=Candidatus Brachybacter algidus TaxID=2982024 RepID=UPI001E14A98B|nr:hypothetical protein [Candidatus Brachybacter algidus]MBK6448760.1 hypothetical protein [Candidatus Brachybacter algidus]